MYNIYEDQLIYYIENFNPKLILWNLNVCILLYFSSYTFLRLLIESKSVHISKD